MNVGIAVIIVLISGIVGFFISGIISDKIGLDPEGWLCALLLTSGTGIGIVVALLVISW
jgi:hypothetical protein